MAAKQEAFAKRVKQLGSLRCKAYASLSAPTLAGPPGHVQPHPVMSNIGALYLQ